MHGVKALSVTSVNETLRLGTAKNTRDASFPEMQMIQAKHFALIAPASCLTSWVNLKCLICCQHALSRKGDRKKGSRYMSTPRSGRQQG